MKPGSAETAVLSQTPKRRRRSRTSRPVPVLRHRPVVACGADVAKPGPAPTANAAANTACPARFPYRPASRAKTRGYFSPHTAGHCPAKTPASSPRHRAGCPAHGTGSVPDARLVFLSAADLAPDAPENAPTTAAPRRWNGLPWEPAALAANTWPLRRRGLLAAGNSSTSRAGSFLVQPRYVCRPRQIWQRPGSRKSRAAPVPLHPVSILHNIAHRHGLPLQRCRNRAGAAFSRCRPDNSGSLCDMPAPPPIGGSCFQSTLNRYPVFLVDSATHYGQVMPMLYASYPQINPQIVNQN